MRTRFSGNFRACQQRGAVGDVNPFRLNLHAAQLRERLGEPLTLLIGLGGHQILGRGKVGKKTFHLQPFEFAVMVHEGCHAVQRQAQPPQSGINLQVKFNRLAIAARAFRVSVKPHGGGNRGRQPILNQVGGVAHVKPAEQKDGLLDSRRAQLQGLLDGRHAKPIHAALGKTLGNRHGAMAIGVGLDHGHDLARAGQFRESAENSGAALEREISTQVGRRSLSVGMIHRVGLACHHGALFSNFA